MSEVSLSCCLEGLRDLFLPLLMLIIAGFVILGGRSVVMALLLDLVKAPLVLSWMSFSFFFRYPVGSGRALLAGTLPLRCCFDRFACKTPTWSLLAFGGVRNLVAANLADRREVVPAAASREFFWVRNSGFRRKRIRLNRKTLAHLAGFGIQSRPRVWKRLRPLDFFGDSFPAHKRRHCDQDHEGFIPAQARTGVGQFPGLCLPTSPGLHVLKSAVCSGACAR